MKRFYCNTCKRVKRVRRLPKNVTAIENFDGKPESYSAGDCDRHSRGNKSNREVFGTVRVLKTIKKVRTAPVFVPKKKAS